MYLYSHNHTMSNGYTSTWIGVDMGVLSKLRGRPLMIWGGEAGGKSKMNSFFPQEWVLKISLKRHSRGTNKSIFDFSSPPDH